MDIKLTCKMERAKLDEEIDRIGVTDDVEELIDLYIIAQNRLLRLFNYQSERLRSQKLTKEV